MLLSATAHGGSCIDFIPSGGGGSFWKSVDSGAVDAGKVLGYDIYFRGPQAGDQAGIQNMVLIAPGSLEVRPAIGTLRDFGIPWIYVDRCMGVQVAASMVGTDNYKARQLAGEAMAQCLNGKGMVLLFRMKHSSRACLRQRSDQHGSADGIA